MKTYKIFVDGSAGTTGLRILDRLSGRPELELLTIPEADRKNLEARAAVIAQSDLTFLCLPDAASREIVPLIPETVRVLDTSTAHRTAPGWVYGLPELAGQRERIVEANRVAVPGCHATGFAVLAAPLVQMGLVPADYPFSLTSLTGYSGGGKSMIADYEAEGRDKALDSPRSYGLALHHKHLPEMQAVCGRCYLCTWNCSRPRRRRSPGHWRATTRARARSPFTPWAKSPTSWPPTRWRAPTGWRSTAPPPPTAARCCCRQCSTIWARVPPAQRCSA